MRTSEVTPCEVVKATNSKGAAFLREPRSTKDHVLSKTTTFDPADFMTCIIFPKPTRNGSSSPNFGDVSPTGQTHLTLAVGAASIYTMLSGRFHRRGDFKNVEEIETERES